MLSRDDNEPLTRSGPRTAMGALIRQYGIPVAESKELEPGGRVKRVRLLWHRLWAGQRPSPGDCVTVSAAKGGASAARGRSC